jgi:hypothetical protein
MKSERSGFGSRSKSFTGHLKKISAHELGRPHARLGNPNTGIPEVVVQPIYDIYAVQQASAMGSLNLFSVVQGQTYNFNGVTAFTKGPGHTTMVQPGMLESSYTFIVRALSVSVTGLQGNGSGGTTSNLAHPVDLTNFLYSFFQFTINRKSYFDGIGVWLPCGGGVFLSGAASYTAPAANLAGNNGWPYTDNVYSIPGGQYINPQELFGFVINPTLNAGGTPTAVPTATAAPLGGTAQPGVGLMAWVRLDGTLIRVAQ